MKARTCRKARVRENPRQARIACCDSSEVLYPDMLPNTGVGDFDALLDERRERPQVIARAGFAGHGQCADYAAKVSDMICPRLRH